MSEEQLKLCALCTSTKHAKDKCPRNLDYNCVVCQSKDHISALCSKFKPFKTNVNICLNSSNSSLGTFLLPTYTVNISRGNMSTEVRCLVDTGSQRSYPAASAAKRIGLPLDEFDMKGFASTFLIAPTVTSRKLVSI